LPQKKIFGKGFLSRKLPKNYFSNKFFNISRKEKMSGISLVFEKISGKTWDKKKA